MLSFVIYGAGGHANVVADLVKLNNGRLVSFFADDRTAESVNDVPITLYEAAIHKASQLIIGIGNNVIREKLATTFIKHDFGTLIHPRAVIADGVAIGNGTVILAHSVVQVNVNIGNHVIINCGTVIDHDAIIEDYVHIAPNAYIGGGAIIKKGAIVGPGAVIMRNVVINEGVVVPPLSCIS